MPPINADPDDAPLTRVTGPESRERANASGSRSGMKSVVLVRIGPGMF